MILLFNHVSEFEYEAVEQTAIGPDLPAEQQRGTTGEALLVKVSTEPADGQETIQRAIDEVDDVTDQLGEINQIIVFPWAHLTDSLADPDTARQLLADLAQALETAGYEVTQAPFGWYKEWELQSKGHPMSVLRRQV